MTRRRSKKERERSKKKRKERWRDRRTKETELVLAAIGAGEHFLRLPRYIRDSFADKFRRKPFEVAIGPSAESDSESLDVRQQLQAALATRDIELLPGSDWISIQQFFCITVPIWNAFGMSKPRAWGEESLNVFHRFLRPCLQQHVGGRIEVANTALVQRLERALLRYSRMDKKLFWVTVCPKPKEHGWPQLRVTLHLHRAKEIWKEIDGRRKRLFRCGAPYDEGIHWISWVPSLVGMPGRDPPLPVFVDSHALQRFRERIAIEQESGEVDNSAWRSMASPTIVATERNDTFLVEYCIRGFKLGYFVVRILEDMAVATTFLFLTMDSTPEGRQLYRKLRLLKRDKEYLGIDTLQPFVMSDLAKDRELLALFTECGCGHLFALRDKFLRMTAEQLSDDSWRGTAAAMRNYLGNRLRVLSSREMGVEWNPR